MTTLLLLLVFVLVMLGSASDSSATVITFEDGIEGNLIFNHYGALGVTFTSAWLFWDSTVPGNPFPFIDGRGAFQHGGTPMLMQFAQPIHGLTVDGFLQSSPSGPLRQWTLTAFNSSDTPLGSVSGTIIGVGSPIPGTFNTFLPSAVSLSFAGNQIARAEITHGGPFEPTPASIGVDTLLFTPDIDLAPIPEPATLLLWGTTTAGLGVARWLRRRSRVRAAAIGAGAAMR